MARRIVLGERGNGDYGLFVSAAGQDANTSNDLTFDSNATFTSGIFAYGQGSLTARTTGDTSIQGAKATYQAATSASHNTRIAHNLGYEPQVFLRWSYPDELFTNPTGYPSGTYAVSGLTPGRVSSRTDAFTLQVTNVDVFFIYSMANRIGYGLDFEVDNNYLYIANYEAGFVSQSTTNGSQFPLPNKNNFSGLTIYYAYIITTAPNNGLKL